MSTHFSKISILSSYTNLVEQDEIFPKKLPELIVGPVYDECGFTLNERLALRQAWRVIKPLERSYGKLIYFDFLMEHYKSIESFRHNGKLDLYRLHNHSLAVMRFISSIIEQNDPVVFQAVLVDNYNMHCRAHVNPEYIKIIARALINYVLDKLKDICSASLESGFERLLEKFNALYNEEKSKGLSFMFRRSQSKDISKSVVSAEPE